MLPDINSLPPQEKGSMVSPNISQTLPFLYVPLSPEAHLHTRPSDPLGHRAEPPNPRVGRSFRHHCAQTPHGITLEPGQATLGAPPGHCHSSQAVVPKKDRPNCRARVVLSVALCLTQHLAHRIRRFKELLPGSQRSCPASAVPVAPR